VGINRTGDQLIMVTVDGRHRSFTGVNGQSMASIMIELGSEQAILMDGGGSTTMATRPLGDTVSGSQTLLRTDHREELSTALRYHPLHPLAHCQVCCLNQPDKCFCRASH
jgi:hypothetical protein